MPDDPSIDLIRQRMARIRMRAQGKADRLGEETRQFLSWKHYVKLFPWSTVAAAVVVGYYIVPRRGSLSRPTANALLDMAKQNQQAVQAANPPATQRTQGMFDGLVSLAGNALLKAGLTFATQYATKMVTESLTGQPSPAASEPQELPRHDYV